MTNQSLFSWPNQVSIADRVAQLLVQSVANELDIPDEDPNEIHRVSSHALANLAPDLPTAVANAMSNHPQDDELNQTLDQQEWFCAQRALKQLPPTQLNALKMHIRSALQDPGEHQEIDIPDWMNWAEAKNVNPNVTSFLKSNPEFLNPSQPPEDEPAHACPRTWVALSNVMYQTVDMHDDLQHRLFKAIVGETAATAFVAFLEQNL